MMAALDRTRTFEDDVRRVAEAIWGLLPGEIQPAHFANNMVLHELDGLAELRDITHVLMMTTSTKLEKIKADVKKLNAAAELEKRRRGVPVEKWLITERKLEAQHLDVARRSDIKALTLEVFKNRFFDGRAYVSKRKNHAFGSARNLRNNTISIPDEEFVELPMTTCVVVNPAAGSLGTETSITLQELIDRLQRPEVVVLLGPFGAGKSITAREIFMRLANSYVRTGTGLVPIAINLREHWGALYGDEILERHARSIGFTPKENLTTAWRAGLAALILDGFDEVASQAIARTGDRNFMRQARREALQGVKDLLTKVPAEVGVLVCGRDHYFDNLNETAHSLGLSGRRLRIVRLGEFTEGQTTEFLRRYATTSRLPDWLPRKPLLLGYLAHQNLLPEVLSIDGSRGFGYAWDEFLTLVCAREAEHDRAVMDPVTVRRVLERLAADVRSTASGTGPISGLDLAECYRAVTNETAGEGVLMQLQRLPGLTPREQDPTARSFIDADMLAALQGGDLTRIVLESQSLALLSHRRAAEHGSSRHLTRNVIAWTYMKEVWGTSGPARRP